MSQPQTGERVHRRRISRLAALWTSIATLAGLIFAADTLTNLEIAVAVLYVVVVLLSVRGGRPRAVVMVGAGCAGLTLASFLLSRGGAFGSGVANCFLSLLAIGVTTVLAMRIEAASAAARQAQADLAHLSRVMIVSELATSVAHEVSQPLAAIVANSSAALRWLSKPRACEAEVRLSLERIVEDAARAGAVVTQVRALVRRAPPVAERVDLGTLILDALALLRPQIQRHRIMLQTELSADLPSAIGDRVQLQQVILNLMMNAIEALSGVPVPLRELVVGTMADGTCVGVRVQDGGNGIPLGDVERVFEPFYSTKPQGMGVGLSISRSIIAAHGGTILVRRRSPRGMVFEVSLPRAAGPGA